MLNLYFIQVDETLNNHKKQLEVLTNAVEDLQKQIADAHEEIATLRNKIAENDTIKLDEIVDMINKMDNRVSKLEADVFKLK